MSVVKTPVRERDSRTDDPLLTRRVERLARVLDDAGVASELAVPGRPTRRTGTGEPAFRATFRDARALRPPVTEYQLGRAYVNGEIDLEGDMLAMLAIRDAFRFGAALGQKLRFGYDLLMRSPTAANRQAIHRHYTLGDDFYLTFIDRRYRFYSHCVFEHEDEELEDAAEHKLESMWRALGLEPGMRLLDIGGGWGGVTEYCGARGVHVTSLTIVQDSANYIRRLIREQDLPGEVIVEDVLDHRPAVPYDHAVIYGVIEHIPYYRRFCDRVWNALRPGGRLYLDASATKEKFAISPFTRAYTWTGAHSFFNLQGMIAELLYSGFEVVGVRRETKDYELTIRHWAERLDDAHEEVAERWGEDVYRAFRIFLWGGCHAFRTNRLQAYHVVSERRADPGPRPGLGRRLAQFAASIR